MANIQMGQVSVNIANARKAVADPGSTSNLGTPGNYASISALRTRLAAIDAAYYTSARLDQMTVNDMVYAVRLADDGTSIQ